MSRIGVPEIQEREYSDLMEGKPGTDLINKKSGSYIERAF